VLSICIFSKLTRRHLALRGDSEDTPLQLKLNALAELIAKLGSVAGLALFVALMIRFFVQLGKGDPPRSVLYLLAFTASNTQARTPAEHGIAFVNILIIAVTLVVVAIPEGALSHHLSRACY